MYLEDIKTTDFAAGRKYIFVLPFGATEQHGPFAPLGTDSFIEREVIARVAPKFPEIIFLPTFSITASQEHEGFAGSVWLRKETFDALLLDVCTSLHPYASTIVFSSFHGGNLRSINEFVTANRNGFTGTTLIHAEFDTDETTKKTEELLGGVLDEHAGNSEISMVLAIRPELVTVPENTYPKRQILNAWDSNRLKDVSEDGIVDNNPRWVIDKKLGETFVTFSAQELEDVLNRILSAVQK